MLYLIYLSWQVVFDIDANDVLRGNGVLLDYGVNDITAIETNLNVSGASANTDQAQRRVLLEELGTSEEDFLGVAAMYQRGEAIVTAHETGAPPGVGADMPAWDVAPESTADSQRIEEVD